MLSLRSDFEVQLTAEVSMYRKATRGMMVIQAIVVIFIIASIVSALLIITTAGTRLEQSRDFKFKSRDIGEAVLDISLDALSSTIFRSVNE